MEPREALKRRDADFAGRIARRDDSYLEWLGGGYDPEAFDLRGVNELLRSIR